MHAFSLFFAEKNALRQREVLHEKSDPLVPVTEQALQAKSSYTSLIDAAKVLGYQQIAQVCQQILQEEREMAQWLQQNIPSLTERTLQEVTS